MATMFRARKGRFTATWDTAEVAVVLHLLRLTRDFVAPERQDTGDPFLDLVAGLGGTADPQEPSDPALRRLLPPAHRTDVEQASEFRRLTEHSLRSRKAANLATAIAALGESLASDGDHEPDASVKLSLDADQARAMTMALREGSASRCAPRRTLSDCTRSSPRRWRGSTRWTPPPRSRWPTTTS